ncbi:hypothetical protein [Modestobacter lacusdianchii]
MQQRRWRRTTVSVLGTLALAATISVTAAPASAAAVRPEVLSLFPSDELTVRDRSQLTGLRVDLPLDQCQGADVNAVRCGLDIELNKLDGFDLDPRLAIQFDGPVDPAATAERISIRQTRGSFEVGVDRVVWDPATNTLYAHPERQLAPGTTYRLQLRAGPQNKGVLDTFTTHSATDGLLDIRQQIDSGSAATSAGIPTRGLQVEQVFTKDAGTTVGLRVDAAAAPGVTGPLSPTTSVAALPDGARLVFGSYLAPSWLTDDVVIPPTPTGDAGPRVVESERLPFVAVLPPGATPAQGWPTAVFGHGFGSSTAAVFAAARTNATQGLATIGTNVVGHGFGPESAWVVTSGGRTAEFPSYGRGFDQNGDGAIAATEGSSATGQSAAQTNRDALRQTAADVMSLVRALGGTDADGNGTADLAGRDVTYFGQSFGGIYGTMVAGADPTVARAVLNVPGGPITEITRLSPTFRGSSAAPALAAAGLLNGGPGGPFTEELPLRDDPPVTADYPGALAIQQYLADATWLARSGQPETYAPLIRPDRAIVQVAFGDRTVPNPTSYTIVDAGNLFGRTSLYRNDRTPAAAENPHSFLTSPLAANPTATAQAQAQVAAFLGRGQTIDPDGAGDVWEVPVVDPSVLRTTNYAAPFTAPPVDVPGGAR